MNLILKQILARKSVRHFRPDKVKMQDLQDIVRAGMAAPSARNLQAWEFLILDDEKLIKHLSEQLPYAKMLADVNAAIIVLGDSSVKSPSGHAYWLQDTCAATQNILLACEALELGAVWTALYPYDERMQPVIEACEIPYHFVPLNIIPIGVPTGKDKPKNKYNPQKIHRNQWTKK